MLGWIRHYDRGWLRGDLIAGVTVAALIVPKNLGYAGIAGIPLEHGLYAAAAGAILYAIFGTCRQISVGPSSGLAAVAASAVVATGIDDPQQVASFVAGITLASGVVFLLMAVAKLGWIARFLSRAVVTGFLFGAADRRRHRRAAQADGHRGQRRQRLAGAVVVGPDPGRRPGVRPWPWASWRSSSSSGCAWSPRGCRAPWSSSWGAWRRPGSSTSATTAWRWSATSHGVCPRWTLPDAGLMWDHVAVVAVAAVALVLIGFSQTAGDARAFAAKHRYQIDVDQESLAQGVANTGAGLLQGMPVSTSLSASSLNDNAGARTGLASLVSGAMVLVTLLFLAPLFSDLPKAVLAALIIEAVVMGMMNVARDAQAPPGAADGLLDRHHGDRRHPARRRPRRRDDRHRAVARLAGVGGHAPADPRAGPRGRHPGLPRGRRAPRGPAGPRA